MDKGCNACKWSQSTRIDSFYLSLMCSSPELDQHLDPDNGWKDKVGRVRWFQAEGCRELITLCGNAAKWFEPKEMEVGK